MRVTTLIPEFPQDQFGNLALPILAFESAPLASYCGFTTREGWMRLITHSFSVRSRSSSGSDYQSQTRTLTARFIIHNEPVPLLPVSVKISSLRLSRSRVNRR